jgi:hypothetical protein
MSPGQSGALPDSSQGHVHRLSKFRKQCVPTYRPMITRTVRHITSCTTVSCPHLGTPTPGRLLCTEWRLPTDQTSTLTLSHSHLHSLSSSSLSLSLEPTKNTRGKDHPRYSYPPC